MSRMPLEWLMVEMEVPLYHISNYFEFGIAREWYFARQHNIQHNSQTPYIYLHVVVLQEHLRCDVIRLHNSYEHLESLDLQSRSWWT